MRGKRVLVTGASRGLGRALAIACLEAGAREVIAGARNPDALSALDGAGMTPVRLDVTSDNDAASVKALGPLDILINNAGVNSWAGLLRGDMTDMMRELEVNYFGVVRMVRAVAPSMIEQGDGLIVNVSSVLGKVSLPVAGSYSATKAALIALSQALRGDLEDKGVRVITVLPGAIDTDMNRDYHGPKTPAGQIAAGVLKAIESEALETVIGDDATAIMKTLATNPLEAERMFASFKS
ncbi:MAG TPA: SDR family NAD(P)-dependent oxidoreductase [Blastocatellia bacterium]|nr:SDR family NAD(P)-dependent oxidoreductase [Blastocatellia bacterium]